VTEFAWDPDGYLALVAQEIADYPALQRELVNATAGVLARAVLDLGCGTGETARRLLNAHPGARLTGIDANADMLAAAAATLDPARVTLRQQRLQDPLPAGPFDLVVSALAVHHLAGPAKAELFSRVATVLSPGGRFVLADLVVPQREKDAFTEVDWVDDVPSTAAEQAGWLTAAGLDARTRWQYLDLAVLTASRHR
jgi:tRNA (cmo5U34)-methyltransferase